MDGEVVETDELERSNESAGQDEDEDDRRELEEDNEEDEDDRSDARLLRPDCEWRGAIASFFVLLPRRTSAWRGEGAEEDEDEDEEEECDEMDEVVESSSFVR